MPTFVDLEIDRFPLPAARACGGDRTIVDVIPPGTIADALVSAPPGSTIRVAGGTWTESPTEPTALTWLTDDICLLAADGGEVVLQAAPGQTYGLDLRGDRAILAGFTLRGFGAAIGLWGPEGHTQRAVTIERTRVEDLRGDVRDGIAAYGDNRRVPGRPPTVDGLLLLDVLVDGADVGVSCNAGPCAHWWVERSVVRGRQGSESSGADTIAVEDGRQVVIVDTIAARAAADGIDLKADDVVILGARVLDAARNGIKLWRGGDVLDSVVDGSGADAALVGEGPGRYRYAHVLVTNHDPSGSGYVGWWADEHSGPIELEIIDSVFAGNASGGLFAPAHAIVSLRHDDFADAGSKLLDLGGAVWMTADLGALEAAGLGSDNLSADPMLGACWLPAADSPLIDAGEHLSGLDRDLWGAGRVVGAGPDIGPVERSSAAESEALDRGCGRAARPRVAHADSFGPRVAHG